MNSEITLDDIKGSGDSASSIRFDDDDNQAIDLTEIIKYDKQKKVSNMVDGMEQYLKGNGLTKEVASYLGLPLKQSQMDPTGGMYNNRFGGEGFFTTVMDGLKNSIIYVINFIKKIVLWCVDKVKTVFGFGNSERQAEVLATELPKLKEEMSKYLLALGFPAHVLDIDRFIGSMPAERKRLDQLKVITYKLKDKETIISDIKEMIPLSNEVIVSIGIGVKNAARAKQSFNKTLSFVKKDIEHGYYQSNNLEQLKIDMLEVIKACNFDKQVVKIQEMIQKLAGIETNEEEIKKNFSVINEKLSKEVTDVTIQFDRLTVKSVEQLIGFTTIQKMERGNSRQDFAGDLKLLGSLADVGDLQVITAITQETGNNAFIVNYNEMISCFNAYANFSKASLITAKDSRRLFEELTDWYGRTNSFMFDMIADDLKKVRAHLFEATTRWDNENKVLRQRGLPEKGPFPVGLTPGGLPSNLVMLDATEAQTAMEKMGQMSKELIEIEELGIQKVIKRFKKETGF